MGLLKEDDKKYLSEEFEKHIEQPVNIIHFTSNSSDCMYCPQTKEILEEVEQLHTKITLTVYDGDTDKENMEKYKVALIPSIIIPRNGGMGMRYYGIPGGYEFSSLIEDIIDVGKDMVDLSPDTIQKLATIKKPFNIKVFITLSCPYCPQAVRMAHKFAFVNSNITGEMIEANEYPQLSQKYSVSAVPRMVMDDDYFFEGALPEPQFIQEVLKGYKE